MSAQYNEDFYEWTLATASALRAGCIEGLDLEAVAEEIESLGKSNAHELYSRVSRILEHRLKLDLLHGPILERNQRGWRAAILRQRVKLGGLFADSPSLGRQLDADLVRSAYREAARIVAVEFDVTPSQECPYSVDDVLTMMPS